LNAASVLVRVFPLPQPAHSELVEKLTTQKGIVNKQKVIPSANHSFDGKVEPLMTAIGAYLDKRLGKDGRATSAAWRHGTFSLDKPAGWVRRRRRLFS
jgi:hypothetical protein